MIDKELEEYFKAFDNPDPKAKPNLKLKKMIDEKLIKIRKKKKEL